MSMGQGPGRVLPSTRQLAYQEWERGLFLHFGLRTFYEGWVDFDERLMEAARFLPSALDCEQWVRVAKGAGFRYMILTAKHHDGFANWPSATTDFSVAASPWRNGQGDVIRVFSDACHKYGMRVGLYYSPYDAASPVYDDPRAYDDYFLSQISELLLPYGQIDILWFDGCGSGDHEYDWPRIMAEVRRMQPQVLIFNMGDPDIRWIGNEDGYAPLGTHNVVPFGPEQALRWLAPECDARVRDRNWFYSARDAHTVKSPAELMGMYDLSCGRGCNMLINVAPDRRGLLPDPDVAALTAFGQALRDRFAAPVATLPDWTQESDTVWTYETIPYTLIDQVVIGEDLRLGESVERFAIQVWTANHGRPITVYEGRTVGHKAIGIFPLVRARKVALRVLEASGPVKLSELELHAVSA